MAIVAHGLGQPEKGAIVAGGLGATETDPNALRAVLAGSALLMATLTATAVVPPVPTGTGGFGRIPLPPLRRPQRTPLFRPTPTIPGPLVAHLTGASHLTASLDYEIDVDALAYELSLALLLDLV